MRTKLQVFIATAVALLAVAFASAAIAADPISLKPIPEPLPVPSWLETDQRLVFNINSPDDGAKRLANIVCGPTNAGLPGYVGGPWAWDGKDTIYSIWDGKPVDVKAIRAKVDATHAKGMRVIGEMMRMWDPEMLYIQHSEWQELTTPDAKPRGPELKKEWPPVTGCWNSGYGDFYIKQCQEIVKRLGWDGGCLDGFGCWSTCYCPACLAAYKADTGREIPYSAKPQSAEPGVQSVSAEDLNNVEFRQYLKWRLNRYTFFVDKWMRAMRETNPDFAAFYWSTGPGRWWHWSFAPLAELPDAANRLINAPIAELFWDFPADQGTNLLPSFLVRYYRGLAAERPVWMLPYFCTQGQQDAVAPKAECAFRLFTVLTNGGHAAQATWQHNDNIPADYFSKLIKDREPWTTNAKSVKWAAMLVGESSRLLYGVPGKRKELGNAWIGSGTDTRDKTAVPPGERRLPAHMESAVGVFRAAMEEHIPLDIITEQDIEQGKRLGKYKVLILPNAACLSQRALESICTFVKAGGGLVGLHESSLCDEFGTRRADFGLADLFKASFVDVEDHSARWPFYNNSTYLTFAKHSITDSPVIKENSRAGETWVDYIGLTTKVTPAPGAEVVATRGNDPSRMIIPGSLPPFPELIKQNPATPDQPFLITSSEGKGRVAYFAADIGQSYFVAPYQYQRKLLANAIRWTAADAQQPITVVAPMNVQSTFYEQDNGKRIVVHLLNETNTTGDRALPEGNTSMREEIAPVYNINVVFNNTKINRVHLEPEGKDLDIVNQDKTVMVTVPRLDMHSMVVAEVGDKVSTKTDKPISHIRESAKWFKDLRFGIFVHWGLYSIPAKGEWLMAVEKWSPQEYGKFAKQWNPKKDCVKDWVKAAKGAGAEYMVLTTRHHEGFSLFDSKYSIGNFTSMNSPAKHDFVADFARETHKAGLRTGLYYSLADWRILTHTKGHLIPENMDNLNKQAEGQVRELMTNYGKVDILWWDGPFGYDEDSIMWGKTWPDWHPKQLNDMARQLQPNIAINNRAGIDEDFSTPEQEIRPEVGGKMWEACMTMNDHWGYDKWDDKWKSTADLIDNIIKCSSNGGSYLLNIGPMPDGSIPKPALVRLKQIGQWMKVYGEMLHGSEKIEAQMIPFTVLKKGDTLYFPLRVWPGTELRVIDIPYKLSKAWLVKGHKAIKMGQKGEFVRFYGLPEQTDDPYCSVIAAKIAK